MTEFKILTVVGARPQFVKAAPVSRCMKAAQGTSEIMVHTGQHFDPEMSKVFFDELEIPEPTYNLGINSGTHGAMTGRMLEALEAVMIETAPDLVIVYGDTNSTLAGALAAAKLHVPVAHVEAGLRSFNKAMPEEINRVLSDHVSSLLLCPTTAAIRNLEREGIVNDVHWVGDVMFDASLFARESAKGASRILEHLSVEPGRYALATIHRAENTDSAEHLAKVIGYIKNAASEIAVVLPLHPRTKQAAQRFGIDLDGLSVCPPLGYLEMARLIEGACTVFTDSGGVQKEAYFFRKPCVTLRDETEWVETIQCGWNRLWRVPNYEQRKEIEDYGDGQASEKILRIILEYLSKRKRQGSVNISCLDNA